MNYIKHLNQWMELVAVDDRLSPHHISIYLALFQLWNKNRFPDSISVCRNEVMQISKIGSSKTYYKCLHALHDYGYIQYYPSYNPLRGSIISINDLGDVDLFSIVDSDESSNDNEDSSPLKYTKKNCASSMATQVDPEQKDHSTCNKNDPGASQVVTPLYINNTNVINDKQRERRTHAGVELNTTIFLNKKEKPYQVSESLLIEKSSEGTLNSSSPSCSSSGNQLAAKKLVPRDFSNPSLDQVKGFFLHTLSGAYLNGVDRGLEAEKFFNHYESIGWIIGSKVPMLNWKAACRSWAAKIPYFSKPEVKHTNCNHLFVDEQKDYAEPF